MAEHKSEKVIIEELPLTDNQDSRKALEEVITSIPVPNISILFQDY
jgi:hypothetical protein